MRLVPFDCCYRWVLPSVAVFVAASVGLADDKIDHLVKAAIHLDQAGYSDKAAEIREIVTQEGLKDGQRMLELKMTQLWQVQAEVEQLRLAIAASPQVILRLKVLEFSLEKLQNKGLPLVSLRHLLEKDSPSCLVDETGTLVEFLDFLSEQGLMKTICEPTMVTMAGRPVSLSIGQQPPFGPSESDGATTKAPALGESGLRFDCVVNIVAGQELDLQIRLLHVEPTWASPGEKDDLNRSTTDRSFRVDTRARVQSGKQLIVCGRGQIGKPAEETGVVIVLSAELDDAARR